MAGWMDGWMDVIFEMLWGWVGEGSSERILGWVSVCVNLGSRPSICPHLYPAPHVKAFWAHQAKSPRVWKWKRKCDHESIWTVNTHTPSHMQLYSKQADVSSTDPPPPETTAATVISGTPSHGGVNSDWWGGLCIQAPDRFQATPSTDSQNRQADRQAGSAIHANILKYMAAKLRPSRGQIGRTCRFNCSKLWKSAAECRFNQL